MDNKSNRIQRGSQTARGGFILEQEVANFFNDWPRSVIAKEWLKKMGYDISIIDNVVAKAPRGHEKADVHVSITDRAGYHKEYISVKKVTNRDGFNQIDKRWVDDYAHLWNMPSNVASSLKKFTGEVSPGSAQCRDSRRLFLDELNPAERDAIIHFFVENKKQIVNDCLRGRGSAAPDWLLVKNEALGNWTLISMEQAIAFYSGGDVCESPRGSLIIGRISMQRKGGDGGRNTAKMLQFKMDPSEIVDG